MPGRMVAGSRLAVASYRFVLRDTWMQAEENVAQW